MKALLVKLNKGHWFVIGLACAMAVVPIVASHNPNFAGVAPAILVVLGVLKHAADTFDPGPEDK